MSWQGWPNPHPAEVPLLKDRAPFSFREGVEAEDRLWKERLVRAFERGRLNLPKLPHKSSVPHREAIDHVTHRLYHVARILQTFFDNPVHGNLANPFLESLFILLTWRSRIDDAQQILAHIMRRFSAPIDLLQAANYQRLRSIVERAGFARKRPQMVVDLVEAFVNEFPDADLLCLSEWPDERIISFLTSISGVGVKSALCVLGYSLGRNRFAIDSHVRRVLRRSLLLREVFGEEHELEHREFQARVENYVPPSVRRQLHAGLVALGKSFCLPDKPRCMDCPIAGACASRRKESLRNAAKRRFTHIELFSGAGGFGQGFETEGFKTILAIDKDANASLAYSANHISVPEKNVLCLDLDLSPPGEILSNPALEWRSLLSPGRVHVITAGIPCQGFSKAGYRTRPSLDYNILDDPRNHLYKVVISWADKLQPSYVVIENVPGMRSAGSDGDNMLESVKRAFCDIGYSADYGIVNAADFGVAQNRYRLILIASHPKSVPVKVHDLSHSKEDQKTLMLAIGDLPAVGPGQGAWYTRHEGKVITGHKSRHNNTDDLAIFEAISPGERYVDFVERRSDILERRREDGIRSVYGTDSFPDKFFKLPPLEPARTIVAHLQRDGNGYIHPCQHRSLTPREAARLQGFADDFVFIGSQGVQFTQIGNAVPPPLARAVANLLAKRIRTKNAKSKKA